MLHQQNVCFIISNIIDKKIMRQGVSWRTPSRVLLKQWTMYTFGKIIMLQGTLLGYFLCDRVLGLKRFSACPVTSLVRPPTGFLSSNFLPLSNCSGIVQMLPRISLAVMSYFHRFQIVPVTCECCLNYPICICELYLKSFSVRICLRRFIFLQAGNILLPFSRS